MMALSKVTVNLKRGFNESPLGIKAQPSMPSAQSKACLADEILPKFLRVFTDDTADRSLAELVNVAWMAAPAQCEWLVSHLKEMQSAIELALGGVFNAR